MPNLDAGRPKRPSASELKKVGVTLLDPKHFGLQCDRCDTKWSPNFPPRGKRLARGYWKCPNGCNS